MCSLKSEKGMIFLTKVLVLAKIGGVLKKKISKKGYLFSARNEHDNHKQRESDARDHGFKHRGWVKLRGLPGAVLTGHLPKNDVKYVKRKPSFLVLL